MPRSSPRSPSPSTIAKQSKKYSTLAHHRLPQKTINSARKRYTAMKEHKRRVYPKTTNGRSLPHGVSGKLIINGKTIPVFIQTNSNGVRSTVTMTNFGMTPRYVRSSRKRKINSIISKAIERGFRPKRL